MARDIRPDLGLSINVQTTTGGSFRLDPSAPAAKDRPRGINYRTKLGEGFSDGGVILDRPVADDHHDIGLMDTWTIVDSAGDVLYEGRVEGQPRTLDDRHMVGVTLVGRMADAKRRKFSQVYVDREPSRWTPPARARRVVLLGANLPQNTDPSVLADSISGLSALHLEIQGAWASPFRPCSEAWYDAGPGVTATSVYYDFSGVSDTSFQLFGFSADSDDAQDEASADLYTAATGSGIYTPATARRYLGWFWLYTTTPAGADGASFYVDLRRLAVYGNTGLTTYAPMTSGQPDGVRATDALRHIINNYTTLNDDGVKNSTYVIPHLAFTDRTYPYDAFLQINKYLLWKLAVWENGTVVFEPHDLTDYTWQVRTDDPNVTFEWQGPSTSTIYNGVAVTYQDLLTGTTNTITPDDRDDLADSDPENPFNKAGEPQWLEVTLSTPQLEDDAAAIGVAELADANRPKSPGTLSVRGHIRDRAGNWQHVGKVRAGETIAITNHPNDAPRLIVETDYQDDNKQVRLATDLPFQLVEAIMDRVDVELQAAGLRR